MDKFKKEIFNEYEKLRMKAEREYRERKQEVYLSVPRIKEIDKEMAKITVDISKKILKKEKADREFFLKELEEKLNNLKLEKAYLLTENNIPLSYVKINYECDKCEDTGFNKNTRKLCDCYYLKLIKKTYSISNLGNVLERENLSTFNIEVFSDKKFEDYKLTPRENMQKNLVEIEFFIHNFENQKENLLLYGTTGVGKTFICNSIANSLLKKGKIVVYNTAFRVLEILENERFQKNVDENNKMEYYLLYNSDLLIIDDLGTEMINSFSTSELFNLINLRILKEKSTIISTNLTPIQLREIYTDRIASRIFGNYKILRFYGPDLRWKR